MDYLQDNCGCKTITLNATEQGYPVYKKIESIDRLASGELDDVVKVDALFRDIWNIPIMEEVFKKRFNGKYPARKSISTDFAHVGGPNGLEFQIDGIAYKG
jgi:enamine deaminase RidA (YjgF/YER057c/UK114 family)